MNLKIIMFFTALLTLALSDYIVFTTTPWYKPTEEYYTAGSAGLAQSLTLAIFPALTCLLYFRL